MFFKQSVVSTDHSTLPIKSPHADTRCIVTRGHLHGVHHSQDGEDTTSQEAEGGRPAEEESSAGSGEEDESCDQAPEHGEERRSTSARLVEI